MTAGARLMQQPQDLQAQPKRREGTFTWADYNAEKQEWIRLHPEATEAEIQQFSQQLCYEMGL